MVSYIKKSSLFVAILLTLMGCGNGSDTNSTNSSNQDSNSPNQDVLSWTEIFEELKKGSKGVLEVVGFDRNSDNPLSTISEKQLEVLRTINFDSLDQIFLRSKQKDTLSYSQITKDRDYYIYYDSIPYTGYYFDITGKIESTLWGIPYDIKTDLVKWKEHDDSYSSCPENTVPEKMLSRGLGTFKLGREIYYDLYKCNYNKVRKQERDYGSDPCNKSRSPSFKIKITEYDILVQKSIDLTITDELEEKLKSFNYNVSQKNVSTDELIETRDKDYIMSVATTTTSSLYLKRQLGLGPRYSVWKEDTMQYANYDNLGNLHGTFYAHTQMTSGPDYWELTEFNHGERVYHVGPVIRYWRKDPTSVKGDTNFYRGSLNGMSNWCSANSPEYDVYNIAKNRFYDPQGTTPSETDEFVRHGDYRIYSGGNLVEYILYDAGREMYHAWFRKIKSSNHKYKYQKSMWVWDESLKDSIHRGVEEYSRFSPDEWSSGDWHWKKNEKNEVIYRRRGEDVYEYEYDKDGKKIKEIKNGKRVG